MKLTCLTENRLREFLEGAVSNTEADQISDHVDSCSNCDLVISKLESNQDHVLEELREGLRIESVLNEPELHQLRNTAEVSLADTTALPAIDEHSETGKRLRDYRLVRKIGEGGMGTVYQAVHVHLAKHVALKILPADKLRSGRAVSRFRQEMRAVGKVNHPNVVSASDAGTIDGQHFLVMELVQGADLARIIHDRGPLKVIDACEIVRQAAIGLQHAHDNGLVHRDVKPSNIMLALDGNVKLLDLGLAGLNNTEFESTANVVVTDRLTSVGQIMGTLDYMAPEQITASPDVDGKADIYALGATLFQLLTGRTPCGDRSEGTPERIEAVLHKPPLDIATLRNDVPEELRALLLKMLAKNPEDRPQSAVDVAGELVQFTSDADLDALAEACRTSLDMPSADVDVTDDVSFVVSRTAQPQDEVSSRRPFIAVALGGLFLTLFAAVVYFIVTNNGIVKLVIDDSFKVAIDDRTVTVEDGKSEPIRLWAGDHTLKVWLGEAELISENFEVRRNGKIVFKVERLEGQVVVAGNGVSLGTKPLPVQSESTQVTDGNAAELSNEMRSDADIRKQLHGVDLKDVQQLRISPSGRMAAGLTGSFSNPGKGTGAYSFVKIWSVETKSLMHVFRVSGKVYEAAFSPNGSTIVAADRTGNLGSLTTVRAWNVREGAMREIGTCSGEIDALHFSPDSRRIAVLQQPDYFFNAYDLAFQLKVWQINGEGNVLTRRIPNPLGDMIRICPPIGGWSEERKAAVTGRVIPHLVGFSSDGKRLICETKGGLRTTYDSQSGQMLSHSNASSVGMFKSMLMIALDEVPDDVNSLVLEITPLAMPIQITRNDGDWWRTDEKFGFKIDGEHFISLRGEVETREPIAMSLGLRDETNLAGLSSLQHPLGVIRIERDTTGLQFRFEQLTDADAAGETLQTGRIRWASKGVTDDDIGNGELSDSGVSRDIPAMLARSGQSEADFKKKLEDRLEIKEQNKHLVHVRELDCPLPASWQYQIYIPREKSAPTFRLVTGVCEDTTFDNDKLTPTASVPVPLAREQFVLNITIRRASDGEYKCYAYIVGPKNADFHEIALPAVENLKMLTDPRQKYFETGRRVMASGQRHKQINLYQPEAAIPLVLLKPNENSSVKDYSKEVVSHPAVWIRLKVPKSSNIPPNDASSLPGANKDTVKAAAEGATAQAQPVIKMLKAITSNNPDLLKSVLSYSQLADFNDAEPARNDGLNDLKQMMLGFYETTHLDLKAFRYEYRGNDEAGQVVFTYRGKFKDSIDVVKQGLHWKISGPTKGFN